MNDPRQISQTQVYLLQLLIQTDPKNLKCTVLQVFLARWWCIIKDWWNRIEDHDRIWQNPCWEEQWSCCCHVLILRQYLPYSWCYKVDTKQQHKLNLASLLVMPSIHQLRLRMLGSLNKTLKYHVLMIFQCRSGGISTDPFEEKLVTYIQIFPFL